MSSGGSCPTRTVSRTGRERPISSAASPDAPGGAAEGHAQAAERAAQDVGEPDGQAPHALDARELTAVGDPGGQGTCGGEEDGLDDPEEGGHTAPRGPEAGARHPPVNR